MQSYLPVIRLLKTATWKLYTTNFAFVIASNFLKLFYCVKLRWILYLLLIVQSFEVFLPELMADHVVLA